MPYPTKLHPALDRVFNNAERELATNQTRLTYVRNVIKKGSVITVIGNSDEEDHLFWMLMYCGGGGAENLTAIVGQLLGIYNENCEQIQFGRHIYNSHPAAGKVLVELLAHLLYGDWKALTPQIIG